MSHYRLTAGARRNLTEIWSYIAVDNFEAANQLIDTVFERFESLAQMPLSGRARSEVRPGLRSTPVGNYVIFYRPLDEGIEIVRVLHGARDIESSFDL